MLTIAAELSNFNVPNKLKDIKEILNYMSIYLYYFKN